MIQTFHDFHPGGTNWSCVAFTDAGSLPHNGGLILKDIEHDGHALAKDVRLIAFWVFVDVVDGAGKTTRVEAKMMVLQASGPMTATAVQELRPSPVNHPTLRPAEILSGARDAGDFETFFKKGTNHAGYGLRVDYKGTAGMFSRSLANFEFDTIDLSQIFLLSHYGNSPPHEPGGVLNAARLHPMVKYKFNPNRSYDPTKEHRRLSSIRFDYRLHLYLDALHNTTNGPSNNGNSAGVFRDTAASPFSLTGAATAAGLVDVSQLIFDAVEKPIVLELTGPGLAKGASAFPLGAVYAYMNTFPSLGHCWDNVHWWGGGVGKNIISAPGGFHAAHLHWRWGRVTYAAPYGSSKQFGPGGVPARARNNFLDGYGVLVDPNIWIQSVRFAVTSNDARIDPERAKGFADLTAVDWKSTFQHLRAKPDDIYNPSDIVLWYSVEVHREVTIPNVSVFTPPNHTTFNGGSFTAGTEGTVFINGIFFAHEPEQTGMAIGARKPMHVPDGAGAIRRAGKWFRHS